MEIRSVTLLCEPDLDTNRIARFCTAARSAFAQPLQSLRLATTPFPNWWTAVAGSQNDSTTAQGLARRWRDAGVDYVSLGPVQLHHDAAWLARLPALLDADEALFAAATIADGNGRIDVQRCLQTGRLIRTISTLQPDGFGNLYFAALANCPPGAPYFPVAYHAGGAPAFALAVEAADLARRALHSADNLDEARTNLIAAIENAAQQLTAVATDLADAHGLTFRGIDFSLAPFPTPEKSLGGALEDVGTTVGTPGSLFAAAFITDAIGRARFPRCGFSGLMLPLLEDAVLAQRAANGDLSISDLLSYSAVCGVGLDTLPLPGDITAETLAGVLLDVAALATRLDKPLTARLMPLPGLAAGDPVAFDFPYFADSRVLDVPHGRYAAPLAATSTVRLDSLT